MDSIRFFVLLLAFLAVPATIPGTVSADDMVADDPCDPDYLEALRSRAWMEAEREIAMNQALIYRPDSVLDYTCFDHFLNHAAQFMGDIFSGQPPSSSADLGMALQNGVLSAYTAYMSSQGFSTVGRLGGKGATPSVMPSLGGGAYTCSVMRDVWNAQQCFSFAETLPSGIGPFMTFGEVSAVDPRQWPVACTPSTLWSDRIQKAYNTNATYRFDPMRPVLPLFDPTNGCASSIVVRTGYQVIQPNNTTAADGVCLMSGCTYNPTSGTCS